MKKTLVLGAGGHAKVVAEVLRCLERPVDGFVTPGFERGSDFFHSIIIGNDEDVLQWQPDQINLYNGIGSLPGNTLRWRIAKKMRKHGYTFSKIVHPSAVVAKGVSLEDGVQVMAGVVIQPETTIGQDSIINTSASIDHDCVIGKKCHIAPSVACSGGVEIGDGTHVGTGAVITQGVKIGKGCVVAAGSVVYRDLEDFTDLIQRRSIRMEP